jgi:PLP dependent protein
MMAMASKKLSPQDERVMEAFSLTKQCFLSLKEKIPSFDELSMGMSQDFEEAIAYGTTMVRIGSLLFVT